MSQPTKPPLVYSCSGASSAAQMANHLAVTLDRLQVAEMSCIAGVGGDVESLVRTARSGRPIIALDGCPLHCVAQILKRQGLKADKHYDLSRMGVKKRAHEDFSPEEAAEVLGKIRGDLGGGHPLRTSNVQRRASNRTPDSGLPAPLPPPPSARSPIPDPP